MVVGLDAAGKTTILYKLMLGEVVTIIPVIGMNIETVENKTLEFISWDVGGSDRIRPLWRHFQQNTDGIIFVFDSQDRDRDRIQEAKDQLHYLMGEEQLTEAPLLVFANKQDMANAMSGEEVVEKLGLNELRGREWTIQPCCATTGEGLQEGLSWLVDSIANMGRM